MATTIRPEVSKNNKYWIDKHRHYELKHFCLQYPMWKRLYKELDGYRDHIINEVSSSRDNLHNDAVFKLIEDRSSYFDRMKLVEQTAFAADAELATYILKAVTEGVSYTMLKTRLDIPCGRDTFYDRYRRFFWLLDTARK